MIADSITLSRIVFSLLLLFLPPASRSFLGLYLLCGITDVLDGFLARKLHTESEKGSALDSAADLVFAAVYAVKILPNLSVPVWILFWIAGIAAIKIWNIVLASKKKRRFFIRHSMANKITGILIFLFPLSVQFADVRLAGAVVCTAATVSAFEKS